MYNLCPSKVRPEGGKKSRRRNRLALEWARKIEQQRSLNSPNVPKSRFSGVGRRKKKQGGAGSALLQLNAEYTAEVRPFVRFACVRACMPVYRAGVSGRRTCC